MKLSVIRRGGNVVRASAIAIGLVAMMGGDCTELPDPPREDPFIASLHFLTTQSVVIVGESAEFVVEARNRNGFPISNPEVQWSSTNPAVAAVTGGSATGAVCGRGDGSATIRAAATRGSAQTTTSIRVLVCTRGSCPREC